MVIQQNMQACNANRQLNMVGKAKETSSEKLSSGYKINRSADDAAGLSISEKMRKQIRGLTRAAENLEDGISLCHVVDGAMTEMHDMVNRMNELCVQAANGTNSASDRDYIQMEIDGIVTEFDRIIETTKFNELYVFKADQAVGGKHANDKFEIVSLDLGDVDGVEVWKESKLSDEVTLGKNNNWEIIGDFNYTGSITTSCAWIDFDDFKANSLDDLIKQLDQRGFDSSCCYCTNKFYGIKFVSELDKDGTILKTDDGVSFNYHKSTNSGVISEVLKVSLKDIWSKYTDQKQTGKTLGQVICETLGTVIGQAGEQRDSNGNRSNLTHHYTSYAYEKGTAKLYIFNNRNSKSSGSSTFRTMPRDDEGHVVVNKPEIIKSSKLEKVFNAKKKIVIQAGADEVRGNQVIMNLPTMTLETLGLNNIKVYTDSLATDSINLLTKAQKLISEDRSRFGGYQNRLEHTEMNLKNVVENTSASESRIRDTDMADEMVRYAAKNILSQSGQSMLSQSNISVKRVLSLLEA